MNNKLLVSGSVWIRFKHIISPYLMTVAKIIVVLFVGGMKTLKNINLYRATNGKFHKYASLYQCQS